MKMTCDDLSAFVDAYIDGEFDERDRADFEAHLVYCDACRAEVDYQLEFKQHFKQALLGQAPATPDHLKQHILSQLKVESSQQQRQLRQTRRKKLLQRASLVGSPLAAVLLITLLLPAFTVAPAASRDIPIAQQTVDWHRGDYPLEITDSDPAQVTRWFAGKVDFPVRLPQLSAPGAKLLGGRLAQVQDRRAAYVLYELEDGSRMSVMMFNGEGLQVPSDKVRKLSGHDVALMNARGYEVAVMQDQGLTYSLTTDLDESRFVALMQASLHH